MISLPLRGMGLDDDEEDLDFDEHVFEKKVPYNHEKSIESDHNKSNNSTVFHRTINTENTNTKIPLVGNLRQRFDFSNKLDSFDEKGHS